MNIDFDKIVALARNQAREALSTTFFVQPKEFENQLHNGKAHEEIHKAAVRILDTQPKSAEDDEAFSFAHYAVEDVIACACVEINNLKYRQT